MPKRRREELHHESEVDLIPMMDLALNLTFFFVVLTTLVRDDATRDLSMPISTIAYRMEEAAVPDSIVVNVVGDGRVLSWGSSLSLRDARDLETIDRFLRIEASRQGSVQGARSVETTVILRIDELADCADFQKVVDLCRARGFYKFVLRTRVEDK
jgi:biopolymer transport protein ExbD